MHALLTCKSACGPEAVHISRVNCSSSNRSTTLHHCNTIFPRRCVK